MEEYNFIAESFTFDWRVRFRVWRHGIADRKITTKQFCFQNGIEYPPRFGEHYNLPDHFLIDSKKIEFLGIVRDNILLEQYDGFKKKQENITIRISELDKIIINNDKYLDEENERLEQLKNRLKNTEQPLEKISLESKIASQEAKVKNLEKDFDAKKVEKDSLIQCFKDNENHWKKQIELTDGITDNEIEKYIRSATKKIRDSLNYAEFTYCSPEYGEAISKIIEGKDNEKE